VEPEQRTEAAAPQCTGHKVTAERSQRMRSRRDGQQLEEEDQRRAAWDPPAAGTAGAVAEGRRDDDDPATADAHGADSLIPAADHVSPADAEGEGAAALVARVEGGAVLEEVACVGRNEARARIDECKGVGQNRHNGVLLPVQVEVLHDVESDRQDKEDGERPSAFAD
jgi:hypothetical protein